MLASNRRSYTPTRPFGREPYPLSVIATCSYDKMVKLWDVASGKELKNLKDHTDAVFAVAFNPLTNQIVTGGFEGKLRVFETAKGALVKEFIPVPLQPAQSAAK